MTLNSFKKKNIFFFIIKGRQNVCITVDISSVNLHSKVTVGMYISVYIRNIFCGYEAKIQALSPAPQTRRSNKNSNWKLYLLNRNVEITLCGYVLLLMLFYAIKFMNNHTQSFYLKSIPLMLYRNIKMMAKHLWNVCGIQTYMCV